MQLPLEEREAMKQRIITRIANLNEW
jgi:hypothetical protein